MIDGSTEERDIPQPLRPGSALADRVCEAVEAYRNGAAEADASVRTAVQQFAQAARELALPPERTVLALKHVYRYACASATQRGGRATRPILDRLVTQLIREYFST